MRDDDLILVTEFDEHYVRSFRRRVLDRASEKPNDPITIYIESYGGSVDGLASMVETIETVPNEIITVCTGMAMSAGALLLSFGDKRYCGRYSRIMLHEISGGAIGTTSDVINDAKEQARMQQFWFEKLAVNCGHKNAKAVERKLNRYDKYLTAEQALEFGIVDYIGLPPFDIRKKRTRRKKKTTRRKKR